MSGPETIARGVLRILVADDHEIVRAGVRAVLSVEPGFDVCAEAANGRQAVEMAEKMIPDVAILDVGMPEMNGLEATRQIRARAPRCQVAIFTSANSEEIVREALLAGARAYVLKTEPATQLLDAVRALRSGSAFFAPHVETLLLAGYLNGQRSARELRRGPCEVLSRREREVLQLLAEGKVNKQVAATLGVSPKTVETHRSNVMYKLGLHGLSDLVHYAIRNGIVEA